MELRKKGQIDEAAEAELKAAGEKLEEASAGAKEEAVETTKRTAKKGNKSATKEATEDVSEVATPAKAEVQETPTAATKSDTPKKDSPESVDAELPADSQDDQEESSMKWLRRCVLRRVMRNRLMNCKRMWTASCTTFFRQDGQTGRLNTSRYTKIWMSSIRALDGKLWT